MRKQEKETLVSEMSTVVCPTCRRRLFDITPETIGTIEIKCSRCGEIVEIRMSAKNNKIRAERTGAYAHQSI